MNSQSTFYNIELKNNIKKQIKALKELLSNLEYQHELIVKNDVFKLDACVEKIQKSNQNIANLELERRTFLKDELQEKTMSDLVKESGDYELQELFRSIRKVIFSLKTQKDTNEILIKQSLSYTNKMLTILNPNRKAKTYNSYGKMR